MTSTDRSLRIVIAGAGIGGLVAALSLRAAGFTDVRVFERTRELRPLGVGINVLPHAVRELTELGLGDAVSSLGVQPQRLAYYNRFGQLIWGEPRGVEAGYRWPQVSVHRGEFQLHLADEVRARLGEGAIELDSRLVSVVHGAGTPGTPDAVETATFERTSGERFEVEADLVIAADGIHSALRRQEFPAEGAPPWNGLILWRGTAVAPEYLGGRTMIMAGDRDLKFVAYPLATPDAAPGTNRINFIAERTAPAGTAENADWNRAVDAGPIVELYRDWRFDWLDVPGIIAAADEILEYPMVDREALPTWVFGRSTLLGDAAHAMYPNGSNGSSQAIIDARTLAFHLATSDGVDAALAAYDADRRPATAKLLELTRQTGPERVMQLAYDRAPHGFDAIEDVFTADELHDIADGYKRAAGFQVAELNERASLTVLPA
ncbi:MAG: flavin-dependent oxidoreductase [Pseudoclavibacter sp.]